MPSGRSGDKSQGYCKERHKDASHRTAQRIMNDRNTGKDQEEKERMGRIE